MSEATVPLKDYVDAQHASMLLLIRTIDEKNDKAVALAFEGLKEATRVAMAASDAKGVQHNGLIEMMRGMMGEFINWKTALGFVAGAAAISAIYFGFSGA